MLVSYHSPREEEPEDHNYNLLLSGPKHYLSRFCLFTAFTFFLLEKSWKLKLPLYLTTQAKIKYHITKSTKASHPPHLHSTQYSQQPVERTIKKDNISTSSVNREPLREILRDICTSYSKMTTQQAITGFTAPTQTTKV